MEYGHLNVASIEEEIYLAALEPSDDEPNEEEDAELNTDE
jgi:hypothetical protein